MPTTASSTFEPGANRIDPVFAPDLSRVLGIAPNPSTTSTATVTYTRGTIMAEFSATSLAGVYAPYSSSATSGLNGGLSTPKGILQYTVTVDSLGNVQLAGEFGQTQRGCPMWMPGGAIWRIQELVGLDTNAVTVMAGAVVEGSVASGAGLVRL